MSEVPEWMKEAQAKNGCAGARHPWVYRSGRDVGQARRREVSAAEKLKALDGAATPGLWEVDTSAEELDIVIRGEHAVGIHYWHLAGPMTMGEDAAMEVKERALADAAVIAALRNALPQIVAVVEAAEIVGKWPPENRYDYPPLKAALAALDEALGEQ